MRKIVLLLALLCVSPIAFSQGTRFADQVTQTGSLTNNSNVSTIPGPQGPAGPVTCIANAPCTPSNLNSIIFVDGVTYRINNPDIGAAINAAYAALPAGGGTIVVAQPAGTYNFTTPLCLCTSGKYAVLEFSFGVLLTYTPTTGTAVTINYGGVKTHSQWGAGIIGMQLIGPGSGTSTTGLVVGGANGLEGIEGPQIRNFKINGFGTNVTTVGSNYSWAWKFDHGVISNGGTLLSIGTITSPFQGENIEFDHVLFTVDQASIAANAINLQGNDEIEFNECSFDDAQLTVNVPSFAQSISVWASHFEGVAANTTNFISLQSGNLSVANSAFIFDTGAGTPTSMISVTGSTSNLGFVGNTLFTCNTCINGGVLSNGITITSSGEVEEAATRSVSNITTYLNNGDGSAYIFANSQAAGGLICGRGCLGQISGTGVLNAGYFRQAVVISDRGTACTNGELALSAGWQSTGAATVTAVAGNGQTCSWTITTGTTTAANPTITDTLTNSLPDSTTRCWMFLEYGPASTHTAAAGEGFAQTTLSATAPVFTFNGTPTANGKTYLVVRTCGP